MVITQTPNLGFRGMNRTIHLQGLRLRAYGPPEAGGAGPRPGALQRRRRLCEHGKLRGKCRGCRGEDGGEAMGGEASGRGSREDRRGARTPKPHAMTSMMRRLHHAADGWGSGWVMAASA